MLVFHSIGAVTRSLERSRLAPPSFSLRLIILQVLRGEDAAQDFGSWLPLALGLLTPVKRPKFDPE